MITWHNRVLKGVSEGLDFFGYQGKYIFLMIGLLFGGVFLGLLISLFVSQKLLGFGTSVAISLYFMYKYNLEYKKYGVHGLEKKLRRDRLPRGLRTTFKIKNTIR